MVVGGNNDDDQMDNNNNDNNDDARQLAALYEELERLKARHRQHKVRNRSWADLTTVLETFVCQECIMEDYRKMEALAMEARNAGQENSHTRYIDGFVQAQGTELYKVRIQGMRTFISNKYMTITPVESLG